MTKNIAVFCGAATLALLAGCGTSAPDTRDADTKALKAIEAQWVVEWAAKDANKLAAHYAADAIVMGPGMPSATGPDEISKMVKGMASDPALSLKFQTLKVEVAKSGDLAYTQGSYTMAMTDPASKRVVNDHGSYVTDYRKQADGTWKAVADIATSEVAPSAPPPPAAAAHKKARKRR